jgi:hypothetical protein
MSPEWIQEAPSSSAGVLPLADFVTATFRPTVNAAGSPPDFPANGTDVILMVDPYGETSSPSPAKTSPNLDAFTTCWGNKPDQYRQLPGTLNGFLSAQNANTPRSGRGGAVSSASGGG